MRNDAILEENNEESNQTTKREGIKSTDNLVPNIYAQKLEAL
jgi:hypothetical protein